MADRRGYSRTDDVKRLIKCGPDRLDVSESSNVFPAPAKMGAGTAQGIV